MKTKFFGLVVVLIVGLFLVQALICNLASAEGVDLALIRREIERLERENRVLEAEIVTFSSLTKIASVAAEISFSPAEIVYSSFDLPVAMGK